MTNEDILIFVHRNKPGTEVFVSPFYHETLISSGIVERRADGRLFRTTAGLTDEQLSQINWACATLEWFSLEELKRVLWLGASGTIFLPQTIGSDIDEEIRMRPVREEEYRLQLMEEMETLEDTP